MQHGKFITFEGGEGSGKSTQAALLADRLRQKGFAVTLTREPGGAPFAERLRSVLLDARTPPHSALSEAMLFYTARADHLETTIRPALAAGRWVVCDRFSDSTRAYQGYAGSLRLETIDVLDRLIVAPTTPDLTIIVDVEADVGLRRAEVRRNDTTSDETPVDRYEGRDAEFHQALRAGFLDIASKNPDRCVVVNGGQDVDAVAGEIWWSVGARLLQETGT